MTDIKGIEALAATGNGKSKQPADTGNRVVLVRMSDVEPEQVAFLWHPYMPLGKITMMEGDPGGGKTYLALAITAAVTTGCMFPSIEDGKPWGGGGARDVVYISAEDGIADTLRPRLDAVGADVARVHAITGMMDEEGKLCTWSMDDIEQLEGVVKEIKPALIIIDPVQAFLGEKVDMHRANEVRPRLAALAGMAERHGCAVVIIRHLAKAGSNKAIYRGMGSIDFTAAARSVLLVGQNAQNKAARVMVHIKSSLAAEGVAQQFEITEDGFRWTGVSDMTAADVLGAEDSREEKNALEEAVEWLQDFLSGGPKKYSEIDKASRRMDIKPRTLRRAKDTLKEAAGLIVYKEKVARGQWVWEIVSGGKDDPKTKDDQEPPKALDGRLVNIEKPYIYKGFIGGVKDDQVDTFEKVKGDQVDTFGRPDKASDSGDLFKGDKMAKKGSMENGHLSGNDLLEVEI